MGNRFVKISILFIFLAAASCKKSSPPKIDAEIIGRWDWIYSNIGDILFPNQNPGAQKTIIFNDDGTLVVSHNDSTGNNPLEVKPPATLLPAAITDSLTYKTGSQSAACVGFNFSYIYVYGFYGYQYSISGDTLSLSNYPCLSPYTSVYIRHH